jgi:predicted Zn-dependent peptidase
MLAMYAGTDPNDLEELMRVCVDEIAKAADTVTEAEVARAQIQMKAGLLMALESSGSRAEQLARQMIVYGRPVPIDEIVGKIEAVTVDSVKAAGRGLLSRARPAVAVVGPGQRLESAAAIAETLVRRVA